jgi:regulator of protease activity HflC (stomatin/prohibitin superfamily)
MLDRDDRQDRSANAPGGVAEAMNRVLAAERAALADLETCRQEADGVLEAGRREARSILDRAERLVHEIHARTEHLAAARARQLVEADQGERTEEDEEDLLAAAVGRLAARMTGESSA